MTAKESYAKDRRTQVKYDIRVTEEEKQLLWSLLSDYIINKTAESKTHEPGSFEKAVIDRRVAMASSLRWQM